MQMGSAVDRPGDDDDPRPPSRPKKHPRGEKKTAYGYEMMTTSTTAPPKCRRRRRRHRLGFVCVNDVYSFDDPPPGGWCRAATLIRRLTTTIVDRGGDDDDDDDDDDTATARCRLAVANGDVLGGSSLLVDSRGSVAIDAMNSIPMDLACLGNHEFDHGDDALMDRIDESDFDWLGSNVYYPRLLSPPPNDDDDDDSEEEERTDPSRLVVVRRRWSTREMTMMTTTTTTTTTAMKKTNENDGDVRYYFPGILGNGVIRTLPNAANDDNSNIIKVGIFGLVTDLTIVISSPSDRVVFDPDVLSVARRVSRSLRRRGANVIVALTHLREAEDRMLAGDESAGIDLILGGHEHEPLAIMVHHHRREEEEEDDDDDDEVEEGGGARTTEIRGGGGVIVVVVVVVGGVLVFKCGMNAYWVGTVDLDITVEDENDEEGDEGAIISSISTSWSMHAVSANVPMDNDVSEIVRGHRAMTEERAMTTNFGMELASTLSLDSVVATIADEVDVPPSSRLTTKILPLDTRTSSVRRREATGANMIADAMRWMLETNVARGKKTTATTATENNNDGGLDGGCGGDDDDDDGDVHPPAYPTLAMINGGFIRGDRLYGPGCEITVRDVLREMPFPRTMDVLMIRGDHLREALAQQLMGSSRGPTGAFPHLSSNASLRYGIGINSSSAGDKDSGDGDDDESIRIHTLTVDGLEVIDERKYFVAVTSFVADGSEGCTSWLKGERVRNSAWDGINMSPIRIDIPHPLVNVDDNDYDNCLSDVEACIIVKDASKTWVQDMITRFPSQLGYIKKALGTKFFDRKKQPIPVRLSREEALPFAICADTCLTVKTGNTGMPLSRLPANILSVCSGFPTKVLRKWSNVRSISIKTTNSELAQIERLAQVGGKDRAKKDEEEVENDDEAEGGKKKMRTKATADVTPLARALKKQRAVEVEEKEPSKKTRKGPTGGTTTTGTTAATKVMDVPKSSKKEKSSTGGGGEGATADAAKGGVGREGAPKSSKKKREAVADVAKGGVGTEEAPKSSKKVRKGTIDDTKVCRATVKSLTTNEANNIHRRW
ncbi:hypothetical protein ACHAW5_002186 [Stephanodiscus triporus]|uniref:5'-Nucleotidase C-terminal domain-containing protein n=1 Tax=Stephanodiscus triporus TaxID=2934178 RepID=A0ABD3NFY3_9STRA